MFAVAGVFGAGGIFGATPIVADASSMPSGLTIDFFTVNGEAEPVRHPRPNHNARVPVDYNTHGFVSFTFANETAEDSISVDEFTVTLNDESIDPDWWTDEDENERVVEYYQWDFNEVGLYRIEISIFVDNVPRDPFVFYAVSKSADTPQFDAVRFFYNGNQIARPRSNMSGVQVRAESSNANFLWDESRTTYSDPSEKLTISDDGKYMILDKLNAGTHSVTFTVHYYLLYFNEENDQSEWVSQPPAEVTVTITVVRPPRRVTIWDVLIGIGVLAVLGGVVWLINRMSKDIEHRQ